MCKFARFARAPLVCLGSGRRAGGELEICVELEVLGSGRELELGAGTRKRELDSN